MLNISYNVSPRLKVYLIKIEELRKQILLSPISPTIELKLRWEATLNRIYATLKLSGNSLKKSEILKLLSEIAHKKTNNEQKEVLGYKKALDEISRNWPGSENPVQAKDIVELHRSIGSGRLRVPLAGLQHLLDYLQTRSENPIIQAAIVNIEMEKMQLFTESNKLIANLASFIFLSKFGYDFRGFLAYEKEWIEDDAIPPAGGYKESHERALSATNLTLWLEYFAQSLLNQTQQLSQSMDKSKAQTLDLRESFWKLNDRQKSILSYLDLPQTTITNRQIQKHYKTTQITASRDLAKLTNLGLLFSHGKGRSVYYTKI